MWTRASLEKVVNCAMALGKASWECCGWPGHWTGIEFLLHLRGKFYKNRNGVCLFLSLSSTLSQFLAERRQWINIYQNRSMDTWTDQKDWQQTYLRVIRPTWWKRNSGRRLRDWAGGVINTKGRLELDSGDIPIQWAAHVFQWMRHIPLLCFFPWQPVFSADPTPRGQQLA